MHPLEERALRSGRRELDFQSDLSPEEIDRIADGEPYCFRCGKPASSFPDAYGPYSELEGPPQYAEIVREEEGTYNPETNRFACDECYIAIGTPSGPGGWKAP